MDTSLEDAERIIVSITDTGEAVMLSKERLEQVRQLHAEKVSITENGCPQGGIFATVFEHHAYRTFTYFGRKLV